MNLPIPNNWIPVERAYFETYLRICNDYIRDGWANGIVYKWRHNGKEFAFDRGLNSVLVDPAILMNIKEGTQ